MLLENERLQCHTIKKNNVVYSSSVMYISGFGSFDWEKKGEGLIEFESKPKLEIFLFYFGDLLPALIGVKFQERKYAKRPKVNSCFIDWYMFFFEIEFRSSQKGIHFS